MPLEIERKFLVVGQDWRASADEGQRFCQGYLTRSGPASVRVRRAGPKAYITVKSIKRGLTRSEFEYEIPVEDAEEMLATLCTKPLLEKERYFVEHKGGTWEVDVFSGANEGLVLAEIELARADQHVELPDWVGQEVTYDSRYRSSELAMRPRPPSRRPETEDTGLQAPAT